MIVKLPIVNRTFNEEIQTIETKKDFIIAEIDTSFKAHLKWEEQFASTVGCDLNTYTDRVRSWIKNENEAKAQFLGLLKLLYCYINSDRLPTFSDFCGMFDFEVADEILKKISVVLDEVGKTASKN